MPSYNQPKSAPIPTAPDDAGKNDVKVKGKYPPGTAQKAISSTRGGGAATKGLKFHEVVPKN